MKPLQLNRELMTYICTCTPPDKTPFLIRVHRQILVGIMFICLTFGWASSVVFIIWYVTTDLRNALYAIFQIAAEFFAFYTAFVTYMHPDSALNIFLKFNHIREHGKWFFGF